MREELQEALAREFPFMRRKEDGDVRERCDRPLCLDEQQGAVAPIFGA